MGEDFRRVIRRPPGIGDDDWARLEALLADAVARQVALAEQSPHVLRLTGPLAALPDEAGLYVTHEPAEPFDPVELFDRAAAPLGGSELPRIAAGIFDALRVAHAQTDGGRPVAHGGVCPGTILRAPDGSIRVTDFGFAPAICNVLGVEAYLNLAVGPAAGATGAWEVLTREVFDRDDRLAAFIDPEKYGRRYLNTFEPGSDIIAAAFVLHLMAEHRHPYLYEEAEAHRAVEMSEFMAMSRYNGARRQDLRESPDQTVRAWCALMEAALARLPRNRPTAAAALELLGGKLSPEALKRGTSRATTPGTSDSATAVETAREKARRIAEREAPPPERLPAEPSRAMLDELPTADELGGAPPRGVRKIRARLGRKGPIAVGAAAVLLVGIWLIWPRGEKPKPTPPVETTVPTTKPTPAATPTPEPTRTPEVIIPTVTPAPTPSVPPNANVSTSGVTETNRNENAADIEKAARQAARKAWQETAANLSAQYTDIENTLKNPTHADLVKLAEDRALPNLADDVQRVLADAPPEENEAAGRLRAEAAQIETWHKQLDAYAPVIDFGDADLDRRIALLETARAAWPTAHVETLLAALPPLRDALALAERKRTEGDWRAARHFLDTATAGAEKADLSAPLAPVINAAEAALVDERQAYLTPLLADAAGWLQVAPPPADPSVLFASPDRSTSARDKLTQLDLDYPICGPQGIAAAADRDKLFPWTVLNDEQKQTVEALLAWVCASLPVAGGAGGETTFDLVFVPPIPGAGLLDPLWMGQTELTVGQYKAVLGALPAGSGETFNELRSNSAYPVAFVSAEDVRAFCLKLTELLGGGLTARPPLENEWKYAFTTGPYTGLEAAPRLARYTEDGTRELDPVKENFESDEKGGFLLLPPGHADGYGHYAPVRSYPPNRWMLFDMLGNVSEWVAASDGRLVTMGGSFHDKYSDDHTRPISRDQRTRFEDAGMRLVILPPPSTAP